MEHMTHHRAGLSGLVIPVPEAEQAVSEWRLLYDPVAREGIPAHITLLFPFLSTEQVGPGVIEELAGLFGDVEPFDFKLARIGRFPGVIYLEPEPAEPFERLIAALGTLFPDHPPYGGTHPEVISHLTVAHSPDQAVLSEVERALEQIIPIAARANHVWLIDRPRDGRWNPNHRFPLG